VTTSLRSPSSNDCAGLLFSGQLPTVVCRGCCKLFSILAFPAGFAQGVLRWRRNVGHEVAEVEFVLFVAIGMDAGVWVNTFSLPRVLVDRDAQPEKRFPPSLLTVQRFFGHGCFDRRHEIVEHGNGAGEGALPAFRPYRDREVYAFSPAFTLRARWRCPGRNHYAHENRNEYRVALHDGGYEFSYFRGIRRRAYRAA